MLVSPEPLEPAPASPRGRLVARGTAALPIIFTALERAEPWGGIGVTGAGSPSAAAILRNVIIEDAAIGVSATAPIDVDSSIVRRIGGSAITLNSTAIGSVVSRTRVDSANTGFFLDRSTLTDVLIRHAGVGISLGRFGAASLHGVRIENSTTFGIVSDARATSSLVSARPVRIIGSGRYPVSTNGIVFRQIWATAADQDSLRGNAADTVALIGELPEGETIVRAGIPWKLGGSGDTGPLRIPANATLRLEAGASITSFAPREAAFTSAGIIIAEGTQAAPVQLHGAFRLNGSPTDTSRLTHVALLGQLDMQDRHTAILENFVARPSSAVVLRSPGSKLIDSTIDRPGSGSPSVITEFTNAGVVLGATGVSMLRTTVRNAFAIGVLIESAGVHVTGCEVTGSRSDGFRITNATNVRIANCNIEQNTGFGVNNQHPDTVDAANNWWGDPSGPAGPAGDGVSGNVTIQPVRTQRVMVTSGRAGDVREIWGWGR